MTDTENEWTVIFKFLLITSFKGTGILLYKVQGRVKLKKILWLFYLSKAGKYVPLKHTHTYIYIFILIWQISFYFSNSTLKIT